MTDGTHENSRPEDTELNQLGRSFILGLLDTVLNDPNAANNNIVFIGFMTTICNTT